MSWTDICAVTDIIPGTGVCALLGQHQVAVFRPYADEQLFALDNIDPFYQASVFSRGILADLQGEVLSCRPLRGQDCRLKDGVCLANAEFAIAAYAVRVNNGRIELKEPV